MASAVTLAGAGGQLWVLSHAAGLLDLGGIQVVIRWAGYLGLALLLVYSWRSIRKNLNDGMKKSSTAPTDAERAAWVIAYAIRKATNADYPIPDMFMRTSPGDDHVTSYRRDPRPTALL